MSLLSRISKSKFPSLLLTLFGLLGVGDSLMGQSAEEIAYESLSNMESLSQFVCEFSITTGFASSEQEVKTGQFSTVTGKATGIWNKDGANQVFQTIQQEPFDIQIRAESIKVPMVGGQTVVLSDEFGISLFDFAQGGSVGSLSDLKIKIPENPWNGFNSITVNHPTAIPANLVLAYLNHPDVDVAVSTKGALVTLQFGKEPITYDYTFDTEKGCLPVNCFATINSARTGFVVTKVESSIEGYFPAVVTVYKKDDGSFPKQCKRFEVSRFEARKPSPDEMKITLTKRYQVNKGGVDEKQLSYLPSGFILSPDVLSDVLNSVAIGDDIHPNEQSRESRLLYWVLGLGFLLGGIILVLFRNKSHST